MPITKSAKKSLRVSQTKQAHNTKIRIALEIGLKKATKETFSGVVSIIDKAAKRHVIHKNKAARLKSQLVKRLAITKPEPRATKTQTVAKTKSSPKTKVKKTVTKKATAKKA
ncbi:hypothetical protein COS66_01835 [Candidatus Berkelbacteria bacterium CG06_land_8_20_14_3_00_43_10]|uniref:Small ribosomal subunit protein bS20 n=1 Tax=Candidatus Berkelbacteria bacterium CG10_big_fil_rev_8_21_14_0_10_43_14 TaxID=1974515 RepID=A0A2M6R904_9BACT|nr:MAG: hypothetical protein AUK41_00350 [Candidatus Berkelbacteria bacterium CG2_30_43_20]PIS07032.1 MAG: hypothetical protein COT79_01395 [Candidatus Berkelbacteria bacterium CG10_big_fil_rev_8_21_14_0_10_43_14]PIU87230.1 MAG: hypothetical protein COS66_01835 [Candidatus Berkelbacteria bacterium CG06_land_8_20_14_3_00_43_10]